MADYHRWPLWSPGNERYNVDPRNLSLSDEVRAALIAWAETLDRTLDQTYPPSSKFATAAEEAAWIREGRRLRDELSSPLGDQYEVVYFHERGA
jgi:hypothetical protein